MIVNLVIVLTVILLLVCFLPYLVFTPVSMMLWPLRRHRVLVDVVTLLTGVLTMSLVAILLIRLGLAL